MARFIAAGNLCASGVLRLNILPARLKKTKVPATRERWVIAEAIQTVLRREGYPNPYEALKELTRTNTAINREVIQQFIEQLDVEDHIKSQLKTITPFNYTGI